MSAPYTRFDNEPSAPGEEDVPPVYSVTDPNHGETVHQQPGKSFDVNTTGYTNQPPPPYTPPSHPQIQSHHEGPEVGTLSERPVIVTTVTRHIIVRNIDNCPKCGVGILQDQCNPCLVCCAILFFPLGLLFLLCAVEKTCNNCGHVP